MTRHELLLQMSGVIAQIAKQDVESLGNVPSWLISDLLIDKDTINRYGDVPFLWHVRSSGTYLHPLCDKFLKSQRANFVALYNEGDDSVTYELGMSYDERVPDRIYYYGGYVDEHGLQYVTREEALRLWRDFMDRHIERGSKAAV